MTTPMDFAVDRLIKKLHETPSNQWPPIIMIALQAAKDIGHAEGFRAGAMKNEAPEEILRCQTCTYSRSMDQDYPRKCIVCRHPEPSISQEIAGYTGGSGAATPFTTPGGEDRTLESKAEKEDDRLERLGWEALGDIAREIGQYLNSGGFQLVLADPRYREHREDFSCIVLTKKG